MIPKHLLKVALLSFESIFGSEAIFYKGSLKEKHTVFFEKTPVVLDEYSQNQVLSQSPRLSLAIDKLKNPDLVDKIFCDETWYTVLNFSEDHTKGLIVYELSKAKNERFS